MIEIYYTMLKATLALQPIAFNKLMSKAEMCYPQCQERIRFLVDNGLMGITVGYSPFGNKKSVIKFVITDKGKQMIEKIDSLNELVPMDKIRVNLPQPNHKRKTNLVHKLDQSTAPTV
jgi:predicted transcriptional regulator